MGCRERNGWRGNRGVRGLRLCEHYRIAVLLYILYNILVAACWLNEYVY